MSGATSIHPVAVLIPKQGRGGDVRNAPFPPVAAVEHLTNRHPAITPVYEQPSGGDAA